MNVAEQQKPFGTLCRIVEKSNILSVFSCWTILFIHLSILNGCSCRVFELLIEQRQNGGSIWSTLWKVGAVWGGGGVGWGGERMEQHDNLGVLFQTGPKHTPTPTPPIYIYVETRHTHMIQTKNSSNIFWSFQIVQIALFVELKKLETSN